MQKHDTDERMFKNDPYDPEMIMLLPTSYICQVCFRNRPNGSKTIDWFEGSKYVSQVVTNLSSEEIEALKKYGHTKRNKLTDAIVIPKSSYDEFYMKNYRFKHPLVEYPHTRMDLEMTYYVGLWLGDGTSRNTGITTKDVAVRTFLYELANKKRLRIREHIDKDTRVSIKENELDRATTFHIVGDGTNPIRQHLQRLNILNNKHIPECYLKNSQEVRLKLLAGLLDSDGHKESSTTYEITQKSQVLSNQIVELTRSLGFYTMIQEVSKTCTNNGVTGTYYRIRISVDQLCPVIPLLLDRKKIDYDSIKQWDNPVLQMDGTIVKLQSQKEKNAWTPEADAALLAAVHAQGTRKHWSKMNDPPLDMYSKEAKRARYLDYRGYILNTYLDFEILIRSNRMISKDIEKVIFDVYRDDYDWITNIQHDNAKSNV